jgi:hypothetical protein
MLAIEGMISNQRFKGSTGLREFEGVQVQKSSGFKKGFL